MRITNQSSKPNGMKKSKGYWQSNQLLEFLYFLLDTFVGCEINLPIAKKSR